MSEQENLRIVQEGWDAWNAHDPDRLLKPLDAKHLVESDTIPAPMSGREPFRQFMLMYLKAFPDLHFTIDQMMASGDYVISRYTATGTHRGELQGIAPTNRHVETHGCTIAEVRNGKVTRTWVYWDTGHLLRQLGVLPV